MPVPREIDAAPTKDFFIHMLVRDIELIPAIGDLVDNCIDGDLQTHTVMGNTVGTTERLRLTLGFESTSGPPQ